MNSFYKTAKKKSRQMTELVLIGLIMVLFVIVSSWGTKIVNYYQGPIVLDKTVHELSNYKHKDSFDFRDPQNQYIKIKADETNLHFFMNQGKYVYYTYSDNNQDRVLVMVNKAKHSEIQTQLSKQKEITLVGGFDIFSYQEKNIANDNHQAITSLIFRDGNVGDSQMIEITMSIYTTIAIILISIVMIALELSGFYMRTMKKQVNALSEECKASIDEDFKERLKKNKLGFGDDYLYISKNWHYELYSFHDMVLLYYHVHRYGHFNRFTLIGWTTDKKRFVIAKMLTKEKLMSFLQLIYERNPEVVIEKTLADKNNQLYYFDQLVFEMRERQKLNDVLAENKLETSIFRRRANRRLPVSLRTPKRIHFLKRSTRPVIHKQEGPLK